MTSETHSLLGPLCSPGHRREGGLWLCPLCSGEGGARLCSPQAGVRGWRTRGKHPIASYGMREGREACGISSSLQGPDTGLEPGGSLSNTSILEELPPHRNPGAGRLEGAAHGHQRGMAQILTPLPRKPGPGSSHPP